MCYLLLSISFPPFKTDVDWTTRKFSRLIKAQTSVGGLAKFAGEQSDMSDIVGLLCCRFLLLVGTTERFFGWR
jgi:hypothetical protein